MPRVFAPFKKLKINPRVFYTLFSIFVIVGGTYAAIQYANGYYRITRQGIVPSTGLLSANSFPTGAEVLINGRLVTATDDTYYLEPGTYDIEIRKDGFNPWFKRMTVQPELVTQTNAQLFPIAPSLSPLTFTGLSGVFPSPDGQKLLYFTNTTNSASKNGLYVLDLTNSPLSLQRGPRQVSNDPAGFDLENAQIIWSPDSSEAMVITDNRQVMLDLNRLNQLETLPDVSFTSRQILSQWENEMYIRERQYLREFPPDIIRIATTSAKNVYFSPDKKKLLYTATAPAVLSEDLLPPLPATNTQPENRTLEPGSIYVYDREEDKNFKVGTEAEILASKLAQASNNSLSPEPSPSPDISSSAVDTASSSALVDKHLLAVDLFNSQARTLQSDPNFFRTLQATNSAQTVNQFNVYHTPLFAGTFQWYPDSNRLIFVDRNRIRIKEYDNTNDTIIYAGPYAGTFAYPWPDGSKMLILTSFGSEIPNNLYGIELR